MDGMIVGMLKRRVDKYKTIVETLLEKKELDKEQKEFLEKEGLQ